MIDNCDDGVCCPSETNNRGCVTIPRTFGTAESPADDEINAGTAQQQQPPARIKLNGGGVRVKNETNLCHACRTACFRQVTQKRICHELPCSWTASRQCDLRPHGPWPTDPCHRLRKFAGRWLPYRPTVERCRCYRSRRALRVVVDARIQDLQSKRRSPAGEACCLTGAP